MKIKRLLILTILVAFSFFLIDSKEVLAANRVYLGPTVTQRVNEVEPTALEKQIASLGTAQEKLALVNASNPEDLANMSRFNSGELGILGNITNQGHKDTCWSYTVGGVSEVSVLKEGLRKDNNFNFSQDNIAHSSFNRTPERDSLGNTFGDVLTGNWNQGHNLNPALENMGQWNSLILDSGNQQNDLTSTELLYMLDEAIHLETVRDNNKVVTNRDEIKALIAKYGAVTADYRSHGWQSQFFNQTDKFGGQLHAITIVGWDDNIKASLFDDPYFVSGDANAKAKQNGGWLVKNSWGQDRMMSKGGPEIYNRGDVDGLFYLSYDTPIGDIWAVDYSEADENRHNYYYDGNYADASMGVTTRDNSVMEVAAIFQARKASKNFHEYLDEVNIKLEGKDLNVKVDVYLDPQNEMNFPTSSKNNPRSGILVSTTEKHFYTGGSRSIKLTEPVELRPGQTFSVVFSVTSTDETAKIILSNEPYSHNDMTFYNSNGTWKNTSFKGNGVARINAITKTKAKSSSANDINDSLIYLKDNTYSTGEEVLGKLVPTLKHNGETLKEGVHYELYYTEKIETTLGNVPTRTPLGNVKILIKGLGKYAGSYKEFYYTIAKGEKVGIVGMPDISSYYYDIEVDQNYQTLGQIELPYGYRWLNPNQKVEFGKSYEDAIIFDDPYSIYERNTKAVYLSKSNTLKTDLSTATVTGLKASYRYLGTKITPEVTVNFQGNTLVKDRDYYLDYDKNVDLGTAKIAIRGMGDYKGKKELTFKITEATNEILNFGVENNIPYGTSLFGEIEYKYYEDKALTKPVLTPKKGQNYYVIPYVSKTKNYQEVTYEGKPIKLVYEGGTQKPSLGFGRYEVSGDLSYTGEKITPTITVYDENGKALTTNDYEISFTTGQIKVGKVSFTITGKGSFKNQTLVGEFTITPKALTASDLTIEGFSETLDYNKDGNTFDLVIKYQTKTLGTNDYTIAYQNNTNAGKASLTITFKNNYSGSVTKNFTINKISNTISDITIDANYTPSATALEGTVKFKYYGGLNLDELLTSKPVKKGKYKVVAYTEETTNYLETSKSLTYTIEKEAITADISFDKTSFEYTGETIKPTITVKHGNLTLTLNDDYTLSFSEDLKNVGKKTVTITGINSYRFTVTKTYEITKGTNKITNFTLDGETLTVTSTFGNDKAVLKYYPSKDTDLKADITKEEALGLDTYYIRTYIPATSNYKEAYSEKTIEVIKASEIVKNYQNELNTFLAEMEKIDLSKYSEEEQKAFRKAIKSAKEKAENEVITEKDFEDIKNELNKMLEEMNQNIEPVEPTNTKEIIKKVLVIIVILLGLVGLGFLIKFLFKL